MGSFVTPGRASSHNVTLAEKQAPSSPSSSAQLASGGRLLHLPPTAVCCSHKRWPHAHRELHCVRTLKALRVHTSRSPGIGEQPHHAAVIAVPNAFCDKPYRRDFKTPLTASTPELGRSCSRTTLGPGGSLGPLVVNGVRYCVIAWLANAACVAKATLPHTQARQCVEPNRATFVAWQTHKTWHCNHSFLRTSCTRPHQRETPVMSCAVGWRKGMGNERLAGAGRAATGGARPRGKNVSRATGREPAPAGLNQTVPHSVLLQSWSDSSSRGHHRHRPRTNRRKST